VSCYLSPPYNTKKKSTQPNANQRLFNLVKWTAEHELIVASVLMFSTAKKRCWSFVASYNARSEQQESVGNDCNTSASIVGKGDEENVREKPNVFRLLLLAQSTTRSSLRVGKHSAATTSYQEPFSRLIGVKFFALCCIPEIGSASYATPNDPTSRERELGTRWLVTS
jgi:hypothetical protein